MSITTVTAPARTDDIPTPAPREALTLARRTGWAVAVGAAVWAGAMALRSPQATDDLSVRVNDIGALPFQFALFALVTLQLRTAATGTSRAARALLRVEYVLLTLATFWTVCHAAVPAWRDDTWLAVLDAFWPLSMLGMAVIGVKVALAGRWRGAARIWPLVAESWAVVTVPVMGVAGVTAGRFVGVGHLLCGYLVLGLVLALWPHLTGARN